MSDSAGLLDSFGAAVPAPAATNAVATVTSPAAWLEAARGRREWQLWGKARPSGQCPAHPLLCHVVDVAAVAGLLLEEVLPAALQNRLLGLHPAGRNEGLRLLLFVIALHDLGKVTPAFQAKLDWARLQLEPLGFDFNAPATARHHGEVGLPLLHAVLRSHGLPEPSARALARAVTAHHGEFPTNVCLRNAPGRQERGALPAWDDARLGVVRELRELFGVAALPPLQLDHPYVVLLAGLTAVADWIGSMEEVFAYEPPQPSLAGYWPTALSRARDALARVGMRTPGGQAAPTFTRLFPGLSPWPLHDTAGALARTMRAPGLVVVEAPMGEGKTEASLLLAEAGAAQLGQQGFYIGLPTQATANQMLGRVQSFLERAHEHEASTLVLAHGEAELVDRFRRLVAIYDPDQRRVDGVAAESWFLSKKRTLLAQYAVGTIDQALLGVMRAGHAFVRLYGLAGKTVILDEVHAYDTYTSTLLDRLIEWLAALGTTVVLLSATLPSVRRRALLEAYRRGAGTVDNADTPAGPYPRVTLVTRGELVTHHFAPRGKSVPIALEACVDDIDAIAAEIIRLVDAGGCIGWVCNSVARAQRACEAVRRLAPDLPRLLLHSRLLPTDRGAREQLLETWLGPERKGTTRPHRCVVIGTQVLEQSLDVDFDGLYSDIAPADLLLQRAGRLHRHARSNRATAHTAPRLVVIRPAGAWSTVDLNEVAAVYHEAPVRRTLRAIEGRPTLTLPDDIERLVEEVYVDTIPPPDDVLRAATIEYVGERRADGQVAELRLMPRPSIEDDPFGDLRVRFDDDDDPGLHEQLRAATRLGPPSVEIVCVVRRGVDVYLDEDDPRPLEPAVVPSRSTIRRLVERSIGVTRQELVRTLLDDASYKPEAWAASALLRHRRLVAFESGVAVVGRLRLTLAPELGLRIERA